MSENLFVTQNTTWKPPDKTKNPYQTANIVRQVVEVAPIANAASLCRKFRRSEWLSHGKMT